MAGLKDIAQASGVSIRTVGRVLKGTGYVKEDTRDKVMECARRLGYRANRVARSLRTQKSYDIAVLINCMDELHIRKIEAFQQFLKKSEYAVHLYFDFDSGKDNAVEEIVRMQPAAVAFFPTVCMPEKEASARFGEANIPNLVFDSKGKDVESIRIDRPQGVYESVSYLYSKGYRNIAYVGSARERSRLDGYERAVSEFGLKGRTIGLNGGESEDEFMRIRLKGREIAKMSDRPDALQVYSDFYAMAVMAGLHDEGVKISEDIAVVGFDNRPAAARAWPPLTTVAQPNSEVGEMAAKAILWKIENEGAPLPEEMTRPLPTKLVIRESA